MVPAGLQLRIPAGGLVIGPEGVRSAQFEMALEVWPHWLRIAAEMVDRATTARTQVVEAHAADDSPRLATAMSDELAASMTSIAAQAFAVDAMYDSVRRRLRHPPTRGRRHTARYRWITETLRHGFGIGPRSTSEVRTFLEALFKLRDWAVHASNDFRPPVLRADLDVGVEWRYGQYTVENARNALEKTVSIFVQLPNVPKDREPEVRDWTRVLMPLLRLSLSGTGAEALLPPADAPASEA